MIGHHSFPNEAWSVRQSGFHPGLLAQTESLMALSNGRLGVRGTLDEGAPVGAPGTYLAGFYEEHPIPYGERAYGFPEVGQTVVSVADGTRIAVTVDGCPLDLRAGVIEEQDRVLDLRAGTLERRLHWRPGTDRSGVAVRSRRLVSFAEPEVLQVEYEVEALDGPVSIELSSGLDARGHGGDDDGAHGAGARPGHQPALVDPRGSVGLGHVLDPVLADAHDLRLVLGHHTRATGLTVVAATGHTLSGAPTDGAPRVSCDEDHGELRLKARLTPGAPLRLTKLVAYAWSGEEPVEDLRVTAEAALDRATAAGATGLRAEQRRWLEDWWRTADIELEGDDHVQQALRFGRFHVFQATARSEGRTIPSKGLTGPGYDGHAFWDSETFVVPTLAYARPEAARDALVWRRSILEPARERARALGFRGAALPWRTIAGGECSSYWPAGAAALHINADVADAVRRYVFSTGDSAFEAGAGLELLVQSARLWLSVGRRDEAGGFHIDGVTGPDEYSAVVDDNVYTNLMAQANLRDAARVCARHPARADELGVEPAEPETWTDAADRMVVPYDEARGVHPQDATFLDHESWPFVATGPDEYPLFLHHPYFQVYRHQVVKQADLVHALFLRRDAFTADERRRAFEHYEGLTVRDSSLSACVQSIVAADTGHLDLAYDYLAESALMDLEDLEQTAGDGMHIASLAGSALALIFGLGGMWDRGEHLAFRPRLPGALTRMAFAVRYRGRRVGVEVRPGQVTYSLDSGDEPVTVDHDGELVTLAPGVPVRRPLPPDEDLPRPSHPHGRAPLPAPREAGAGRFAARG